MRTRQLLQWVFAAAPGHPALKEVCDHIANSMQTTFSADTHLDTLERTGPGVFTDVILKHAALHAPHKVPGGAAERVCKACSAEAATA